MMVMVGGGGEDGCLCGAEVLGRVELISSLLPIFVLALEDVRAFVDCVERVTFGVLWAGIYELVINMTVTVVLSLDRGEIPTFSFLIVRYNAVLELAEPLSYMHSKPGP